MRDKSTSMHADYALPDYFLLSLTPCLYASATPIRLLSPVVTESPPMPELY
jgi:hypothetical protein